MREALRRLVKAALEVQRYESAWMEGAPVELELERAWVELREALVQADAALAAVGEEP